MPSTTCSGTSRTLERPPPINRQHASDLTFAARQGVEIVGVFEDAGISGASIANRPGFLAMERAAKGGGFNMVICEALDRLSRSQADIAAIFIFSAASWPAAAAATRWSVALRTEVRLLMATWARRVLAALSDRLLAPDIVASAMEEARLEMDKRNRTVRGRRGKLEADLAEAKRRSNRLIDQVADGVLSGAAIKDRLAALEALRATLEAELTAEEAPSPVALHPGIADHYRRVVNDLAQALHCDSEAAVEARDLVRRLIETVVVTPLPERGQYELFVKGQIAALVNQDGDCTTVVGAGAGFERHLTPIVRLMT